MDFTIARARLFAFSFGFSFLLVLVISFIYLERSLGSDSDQLFEVQGLFLSESL